MRFVNACESVKMAAALFSSGAGGRAEQKLVEFRAGRMELKDRTVSADKRKGLLFMEHSPEGYLAFKWKDRSTGKVELVGGVFLLVEQN